MRRPTTLILATQGGDDGWYTNIWGTTRDPSSETQALMEAAPGAEPAEVGAVRRGRSAWVHDLLAAAELTDREMLVISDLFFGQLPLRESAELLSIGKTTVARVRDAALVKLRQAAMDNPEWAERWTA